MISLAHGRERPAPHELLSIQERARYLFALRVVLAAAAVASALSDPGQLAVAPGVIALGSATYLALAASPHLLERRFERLVLPSIRGLLLLDGLAIAGVVAVSGGATSHARFLAFGHVVAVTLLVSYRSGLKLAMWHTLLFLLVALGEPGLLGTGRPYASLEGTASLTVLGLWLTACGTAAFAAISERQLRSQKLDLEHLSTMLAGIQAAAGVEEIARIFLTEVCETFGFRRAALLASPEGALELIATVGETGRRSGRIDPSPVTRRSLSARVILPLSRLDPDEDRELAALMPEARNVLVVPLLADRRRELGVALLELGGDGHGLRRWVVGMVEQFASHAALAMNAAWLTEERESRLRQIQELQEQLEAYNSDLEATVAERTGELRTAIAHLEDVDRQRRRLLEHVVTVGEEERRRIAGDIHDDPVQKLVALKMRLELLGKAHPELEGIQEAKDGVLVSIHSLRHLLFDLRPPVLDEQGLGPALRSFLEHADVSFRWIVEDELVTQPSPQTRLILYRIAQEALTNTRKHAQAQLVRVRLRESDDGVSMEVVDDGVGFEPQDAAAPGHLGLATMRERAEMAGGRCELHSLPGQGTSLDVWMPLHEDGLAGSSDREEEDPTAFALFEVDLVDGPTGARSPISR